MPISARPAQVTYSCPVPVSHLSNVPSNKHCKPEEAAGVLSHVVNLQLHNPRFRVIQREAWLSGQQGSVRRTGSWKKTKL